MNSKPAVLAALGLALALRLAFGLLYWQEQPMTHDEREYLALGANLAAGRGFTSDLPGHVPHPLADRFGRAPGYPAFLSLVVRGDEALLGGAMPAAVPARVKVVQAVVGVMGVWLVGLVAARAAGPTAGLAALLLAAAYPPLVWIPAYALSETLYIAIAMLLVLALGRVTDAEVPANGAWWSGIAGLLAGVACLTRPATLFLLPLAALWLVVRRRTGWAVLLVAVAVLTIAPWTARNWREYGRPVLIASEGGVTFWTGNHPLAVGDGDLAANPAIKAANLELRARHAGLTPEEMEPVYYREALAWIASAPLEAAALVGRKAFYTVVPVGPSYRLHSSLYFWGSVLPYAALLPFALAGAWALRGRASPPRALWLLAASSVLVCLVFFPQERFRIPVIDPALIVMASSWIALRAPRGA